MGIDFTVLPSIAIKINMKRTLRTIIILLITLAPSVARSQGLTTETFKVGKTLALLDAVYVDSVNVSKMAENMIISTLKALDPHSVYIPANEVAEENEPLQGNFEGVGVQFNVLNDTIIVISPTTGGPSEKAGILAGDRIIEIAGEKVTGINITTTGVKKRLMGPKGTTVLIVIIRKGVSEPLEYNITRDKIPVNSLDAAYMVSKEVGYVKLSRFSETTADEFNAAVAKLMKSKMTNLIIDLRSNTGGYMIPAVQIADQMLEANKLIVYLKGLHTPRQDFNSTAVGVLGNARIAILTDEGSASASEILSGAIQDWDRGIIVGRRTFGKGLVQNGFYLPDGSMIRITVARYYTPSGRSIQTPYADGVDKYYQKFYSRYLNGELLHADSINLPDSLKTYTLINKRAVYSGGGITPDVFVPIDTSNYSEYYRDLIRTSTISNFVLAYTDSHRKTLLARFKNFEKFNKEFVFTDKDIEAMEAVGEKNGVKYNAEGYANSSVSILQIMKALVARDLWDVNEYFRVVNTDDAAIQKALTIINDAALYNEILGYGKENK
jgi:carboxyl-terminal processing protease